MIKNKYLFITILFIQFLFFNKIVAQNNKAPVPDIFFETQTYIPTNIYGGGCITKNKCYVWTSDGSKEIKKPIIICDGFDPLNNRSWENMYQLLNQHNLFETLRYNGYDIVFFDYQDGGESIEVNGYSFMDCIKKINKRKITCNKNIVLGPSMGGLVARYALAMMEQLNIEHDTRLYISFDAPHKGANIPLGLSRLIYEVANKSFYIILGKNKKKKIEKLYEDILCSNACKEMLVKHPNEDYSNAYNTFMYRMRELGYPIKLEKIAIANGSGNSFGQLKNNNTPLNAEDVIIEGKIFGTPKKKRSVLLIKTLPNMPPEKRLILKCPTDNYSVDNTPSYDNAPGGNMLTTKAVSDSIQRDNSDRINATCFADKHCFIPTISALDINTSNLFYNIDNDPNILDKTQFDAIFYQYNINLNHTNIALNSILWFVDFLVPDNIYIDYTNSHIWNTEEIQASESITFKPGFNSSSCNRIHAFIRPFDKSSLSYESIINSEDSIFISYNNNINSNTSKDFNNLFVYPIPTYNELNIKPENKDEFIKDVFIYDLNNNLLFHQSDINNNKFVLDLSTLKSDVYILKVRTNFFEYDETIIKQ